MKTLKIVLIVGLVAVAGILVYYLFIRKVKEEEKKVTDKISSGIEGVKDIAKSAVSGLGSALGIGGAGAGLALKGGALGGAGAGATATGAVSAGGAGAAALPAAGAAAIAVAVAAWAIALTSGFIKFFKKREFALSSPELEQELEVARASGVFKNVVKNVRMIAPDKK